MGAYTSQGKTQDFNLQYEKDHILREVMGFPHAHTHPSGAEAAALHPGSVQFSGTARLVA